MTTPQNPDKTLNIPEYDDAWLKLVSLAMYGLVAHSPVLGMGKRVETIHSGPIRNVRSPRILDQPYSTSQLSAMIHIDHIKQTTVDKHTEFICELANDAKAKAGASYFQSLNDITAASNMAFDAGGQPFSLELYLNALEKMDIEFDTEGGPLLPKLIVAPSLTETAERVIEEAEHSERYHTILADKREEFNAKKRTRRLS